MNGADDKLPKRIGLNTDSSGLGFTNGLLRNLRFWYGSLSQNCDEYALVVDKPLSRLELETSPLPRECSTAELQGRVVDGPGWI